MAAATTWRGIAKWYPELAVTRASALRAYTLNAAYAAGLERDLGALRPRRLCDMTVIEGGTVTATIIGGRVSWRRKPA
jgi:imidazolonepropionase-like amidohydrolase